MVVREFNGQIHVEGERRLGAGSICHCALLRRLGKASVRTEPIATLAYDGNKGRSAVDHQPLQRSEQASRPP